MASTSSPPEVTGPATGRSGGANNGPWYFDSTFWKRFSVILSIVLSIASLILSAIASLKKESTDMLKALTVAGIVINSVSIALSALTSLDWQSTARKDRKFAQQLVTVAHLHEGSQVVLSGDQKLA